MFGDGGVDGDAAHQRVEGEAGHPPASGGVELELAADLAVRDHGRQPGRHVVAPLPDDPDQAERDQRGVEDHRGAHRLVADAGARQGRRDVGPQQRQDDHEVERDQQAAGGGIADRRDPSLGIGRPQEGAEYQVEGAPVEQRQENLVAELAAPCPGARRDGPARRAPRPRAPPAPARRAARQGRRRQAASGRPGDRCRAARTWPSSRRATYSAASPATTMPASRSAVWPPTISGRRARWAASSGSRFSVNSSRSANSENNDPLPPASA